MEKSLDNHILVKCQWIFLENNHFFLQIHRGSIFTEGISLKITINGVLGVPKNFKKYTFLSIESIWAFYKS